MLNIQALHPFNRPTVAMTGISSQLNEATQTTEEEREISSDNKTTTEQVPACAEVQSGEQNLAEEETEKIQLRIAALTELRLSPKAYVNDIMGSYIDIVFNNLMRTETNTIVVYGPPGIGKTTMIRQVAYQIKKKKCPKRLEETRVFEIEGLSFETEEGCQALFDTLTLLSMNGINKLIIFINDFRKVSSDMKTYWRDLIKKVNDTFEFEYLKFILELDFNASEMETMKGLEASIVIDYAADMEFDTILKTLHRNIKELEKKHGGIRIPKKMLEKLIFWIWSSDYEAFSYFTFLNTLDYALSIAETQGDSNVLTQMHIKKLFEDEFEGRDPLTEDLKRTIARHEIGHTLLALVFERYFKLKGVRVLNFGTAGGATFREAKILTDTLGDRDFVIACIAYNLAGRLCQGGSYDVGASDDLVKANEIAENFVLTSGTIESLGYHCIFDLEKGVYPPRVIELIYEEKKKLMVEAEALAKRKIEEYKDFIDELTKALLDNLMLEAKEVKAMFDKYSHEK